jgi:predicted permease
MIDALRTDLAYALRQLRRAPVTTVVASFSLAIAIAVAVGVLSAVNTLFFRPLPVSDPNGVYRVFVEDPAQSKHALYWGRSSYADYLDIAGSGVFSHIAAEQRAMLTISAPGRSPAIKSFTFVSPNYFTALGVRMLKGRSFQASGEQPEIVISEAAWRNELESDPAVLGSVLRVNGVALTVIGVAPLAFGGRFGWVPATMAPTIEGRPGSLTERGEHAYELIGRLAPGFTQASASARLTILAEALAQQYPNEWVVRTDAGDHTLKLTLFTQRESLLQENDRLETAGIFAAVAAMIGLVLALACVNVAGLLLARALARRHEIAVRLTLGASRNRLLLQLFTESTLLALLGGGLGCLITLWFAQYARTRGFISGNELVLDWRVLIGAVGVSLLCALAFGFAPALQSLRTDLRSQLSSSSAMSDVRSGLRGGLIAVQVSVSFVLILLAVVMTRGVRARLNADLGFDTRQLMVARLENYVFSNDTARWAAYLTTVTETARRFPGVRAIATTRHVNLGGSGGGSRVEFPGSAARMVASNTVGADYFETLGLRPLRGRVFTRDDRIGAPKVAVVNWTLAQREGGDVIGKSFRHGLEQFTIVGVVPDIIYGDPYETAKSYVYFAAAQQAPPSPQDRYDFTRPGYLMVRLAPGIQRAIADELSKAIRSALPNEVPPVLQPMREYIAAQSSEDRKTSLIAFAIGALELTLAMVGLYGLLLFGLIARTREIGVRLALGAEPIQAGWAVMRDGLRYAAIGVCIGLLLGVPTAMIAANVMSGVRALDPVPFVIALAIVLLAAALASIVPTRRAARVEPAAALRHD